MQSITVTCPVCHVRVPENSVTCPDCGRNLAALIHLARRSAILYNEGLRLARDGDFAKAANRLEQACELDPEDSRARSLLGKVYSQSGRTKEARSAWEYVLQKRSDDETALAGLDMLTKSAQAATSAIRRDKRRASIRRLALIGIPAAAFLAGVGAMFIFSSVEAPQTAAKGKSAGAAVASGPQSATTTVPEATVTRAIPSPTVAPQATAGPTVTAPTAPTPMRQSPTATPYPNLRPAVIAALSKVETAGTLSITVTQDASVIQLTGSASSAFARYRVESAAAAVPGVGQVVMNVTLLYPVVSGDSLWAIAEAVSGKPDYWKEIASANGLEAPYVLQPGIQLRLP